MFEYNLANLRDSLINSFQEQIYTALEIYLPRLFGALLIIGLGTIVSILAYKFVIYIFNKFQIIKLIDRLFISMRKKELELEKADSGGVNVTKTSDKNKRIRIGKISDQIKIDDITAKSLAYYLFLIFFRWAVVFIGIGDVESFLGELIAYLPNLFIALVVGFFGMRFADFVYDVVYHALNLTRQKTAKIIATGAKIIILFFTMMIVLSKIGVAAIITNTILIGFISMLALAGGLAFGLGGKDIAEEILESFKK